MAIIGISGYSGVGKDTVGAIIQYLNCENPQSSIEEICADYSEYEYWLDEKSDWEIRKFAGKLKDIASHLTGIDIEDFEDQEFKKTNLGPEWDYQIDEFNTPTKMTVRDFLQKLGTDAMRMGLHDNVWVNALMADYKGTDLGDWKGEKVYSENLPNWIITDVRFPNEAQAIKDRGGIIIRVTRPGVEPINDHPSETGLDNWKFDYTLVNSSDIFDLKESTRSILKHLKVL
jgi:DNA polymerase III delta prime subunit